jgi:hypothetical protein
MRYVYLFRGVYVDLLHRWSRLFGDERNKGVYEQ